MSQCRAPLSPNQMCEKLWTLPKQQLYSMTSSARPTRCFTTNIPAERRSMVFGKSFGSTRKLKNRIAAIYKIR